MSDYLIKKETRCPNCETVQWSTGFSEKENKFLWQASYCNGCSEVINESEWIVLSKFWYLKEEEG